MKKIITLTLLLFSAMSVYSQNDEDLIKVTESAETEYYILKSSIEREGEFVQFVHVTYNKPLFKLATTTIGHCTSMNYVETAYGTKGDNGKSNRVEVKKPVVISTKRGTVAYELVQFACNQKNKTGEENIGKNVNYANFYKDSWILIDEDVYMYINPAKMQKIDGNLYFWAKMEFPTKPGGVSYQLAYKQADCIRMAASLIKLYSYSSDGKLLKYQDLPNPSMELVIPESIGEFTLQKICEYAK